MQLTERLLPQLEARFNLGTPIHHLPSETLLYIFAILQQDAYSIFASFPPTSNDHNEFFYSLISLTGVCRLWRSLTLTELSALHVISASYKTSLSALLQLPASAL